MRLLEQPTLLETSAAPRVPLPSGLMARWFGLPPGSTRLSVARAAQRHTWRYAITESSFLGTVLSDKPSGFARKSPRLGFRENLLSVYTALVLFACLVQTAGVMRFRLAVVLALVMSASVGVALLEAVPAQATSSPPTLMAGQEWMIKANDLAVIGGLGSYEWIGCGATTAPLTSSGYAPCQPGEDPIYTAYDTFRAAVEGGQVTSGETVIFDNEDWQYTPQWERRNQEKYEVLAALLAHQHGITFINSPSAKTYAQILQEDVAAARYASVVEIQAQANDKNPSSFEAHVLKTVAAIRKVNPTVPILAGLATDALGRPTTVRDMIAEYTGVKSYVQGFWLNANTWASPRGRGCAPEGCPQIARQFLHDIGVS
jgi:hypothetical protein